MMNLSGIGEVTGLSENERELLKELSRVWAAKLTRNRLRTKYYEGKQGLKNLGISIPEHLEKIDTVIGWPAKAVDGLQVRSIFDGFTYQGEVIDALEAVVAENNLFVQYEQAVQSELINSCACATVSRGGPGEPDVVVNFHTAEMSAYLWDYRRKRVRAGLVVVDVESNAVKPDNASPSWVNLYTDDAVVEVRKNGTRWSATRKPHPMGRPLLEVFAYRPSLKRPFGKSRISRAVMSITDNAVRSLLRSELSSEFFTSPQKYLLGATEDDFDKPLWEAYIGSIFLASRDDEGEIPHFGQLPQSSMQPHIEYLRSLAAQFAGETSIPVSSLGVIHDNPSSAEAIFAAREDLVIEAQSLNRTNGAALESIARMALAIRENKPLSSLTDDQSGVRAHFKNPAMPSLVSQADAMVKVAAAVPWIAETEVFLEELGFDDSTRKRLLSEKRKLMAQAQMAAAAQDGGREVKTASMYEIQSIIRSYSMGRLSKPNAMVLFEKIGVDKTDAATMLSNTSVDSDTAGE